VQPVLERVFNGSFRRHLEGLNTTTIAAAGRKLLEKQPRTGAQLSRLLQRRWPDRDARSLGYAVQYLAPLIQIPPRGVWGLSGQAIWTTAEAWLGRPLEAEPSPDDMVTRYLAAFGPATVADIRAWSGVPRLQEIVERLRARLRVFRDEQGRELFDLPDAPRPDSDTPAPPRFLPCYDNALLGHDDRSRVGAARYGARLYPSDGLLVGPLLLDGFLGGRWRIVHEGGRATLLVEYFERPSKPDRAALADEGTRLLTFTVPGAKSHEVLIRPASARAGGDPS
jgi:hypothetical protein